jgi:3-oxoadipate enol-lactonase
MPNPTTHIIPVPGGRLHVIEEGDGPSILLLHAGIADLRAWDSLVPLLVQAGYRAVRYDLRGFGQTSAEPVPFSHRADAIAVLDALNIEKAAFVGNSIGGMIAIDTAVEHPERVAAVVALGAGLRGFEGPEPTPAEQALEAEGERVEAAGDPGAIADFDVRYWGDGPGQPEGRMPAELRAMLREMALPSSDLSQDHGTPIPLDPPAAQRLDALTMPVLAITGELDESATHAVALHLAAFAPNAQMMDIPGVAHMIAMEAPDEVARLTVELLAPLGDFGR